MYSNSKGKQQVQRLKSAVVNLPKFLSRFSFRDTNEFASETKQSLSKLFLCVFKIARWLKRACNILDRSHVLFRLAVEKDLSPVALFARLTLACENIRFSSLFAAARRKRETSPAAKSEEKRMLSQARLTWINLQTTVTLSIGCRSWTYLKIP